MERSNKIKVNLMMKMMKKMVKNNMMMKMVKNNPMMSILIKKNNQIRNLKKGGPHKKKW
jgi:hypothetical protein